MKRSVLIAVGVLLKANLKSVEARHAFGRQVVALAKALKTARPTD